MAARHRRGGAGPLAEVCLQRHVGVGGDGGGDTAAFGGSGGSIVGGGGVAGGKELRVAGSEVAVVCAGEAAERADGHAVGGKEDPVANAGAQTTAATPAEERHGEAQRPTTNANA